jgi:hypothetical protein
LNPTYFSFAGSNPTPTGPQAHLPPPLRPLPLCFSSSSTFLSPSLSSSKHSTHMYVHSPPMDARTPYPYKHIQETQSKKLIQQVLKLAKSPQVPRLSTRTPPPTEEYLKFNETSKCQIWDLNPSGLGCHCPPNHPITGWFSPPPLSFLSI